MNQFDSTDFKRWAEKYEEWYEESDKEYVEYIDENGKIKKDRTPYFTEISRTLQKRGYLLRKEFLSICEWKTKRQRKNFISNTEDDIEKVTRSVMAAHPNLKSQISLLISPKVLKGVGIPVASAILTVIYPKEYCVIDYRTWRALYWIQQEPLAFECYSDFSTTLDYLGRYTSQESYLFYLNQIKELATQFGTVPREIEMALWMFDRERGKINPWAPLQESFGYKEIRILSCKVLRSSVILHDSFYSLLLHSKASA